MNKGEETETVTISVRPGTKVRVVEGVERGSDRDLLFAIPAKLKLSVQRVSEDEKLGRTASTITMCG